MQGLITNSGLTSSTQQVKINRSQLYQLRVLLLFSCSVSDSLWPHGLQFARLSLLSLQANTQIQVYELPSPHKYLCVPQQCFFLDLIMLELFHSEISSAFLTSGIVLSTWGALVTEQRSLPSQSLHPYSTPVYTTDSK